MTFGSRAFVVACTAALGLGASTANTTTTNPGTSASSTTAAPSTTKVGGTPGTSTAPNGAVEVNVVSTPFGPAIGRGDGKVLYAWDKEADGTVQCVADACL